MRQKIRIAHLTSAHKRYDVRIYVKECVSLYKNGYDVSLIVADGLGDEIIDGIKIFDVGASKNRKERFLVTSRKVYQKALQLKCDIYHFHDPELMFYGLKLKKKGFKIIYDIHEDLKEQIKIKEWLPIFFRKTISTIFSSIENYIAKRLDALIVPQPYMFKNYIKINNNTVLVENFVILNIDIDLEEKNYSNKTCFHPGALSKDRGLINMINAFSYLDHDNSLVLAGNIPENLLTEVTSISGWDKTEYKGLLKFNEVQELYSKTSIGLILYNNVGQYYLSYAIKLFEYMLHGIPVIMPNFGEWIEFNKENDCGINVNPLNPREVSEKINFLNNNEEEKRRLGKNGRNAVLQKYNWKIAETRLINLYNILEKK